MFLGHGENMRSLWDEAATRLSAYDDDHGWEV